MPEYKIKNTAQDPHRKYNLNLLIIFDAVYKLGSVKLAASLLNCSSPSVSQSIKRLSDILGSPLFIREGQKLSATPLAIELYEETRHGLQTLQNAMEHFHGHSRNKIIIECAPYFSLRLIPFIEKYLADNSISCTIMHQLHSQTNDSIDERLSLKKVDIIFGLHSETRMSTERLKIGSEKMLLVCRKTHPRLRDTYHTQYSQKEKMAFNTIELAAIDKFRSINGEFYASAECAFQSSSLFSICAHLQMSDSISVIPEWFFTKFNAIFELKSLETDLFLPDVDVYMYFNKSLRGRSINHKLSHYLSARYNADRVRPR